MRNQELLSLVAARFAADAPRSSRRTPIGGAGSDGPVHVCDTRPCYFACSSGDVQQDLAPREGDGPVPAVPSAEVGAP
jgi:hypothetical protein